MKAKQLIKDIEKAIENSGELDPELVVNTQKFLTGKIETIATPLEQGEQEIYIVLSV